MAQEGLVETGLEEGQTAALDGGEALGTDLDAIDGVAVLGEAEAGGEADEAEAEDGDYHLYSPSSLSLRYCRKRATPSSTLMVGL